MSKRSVSTFLLSAVLLMSAAQIPAAEVTKPDEFFGFQLGADRKIARWDAIVEYFELLAEESDKLVVTDMGPTGMGNPFLFVVVSSAQNLERLERLREVNNQLFDARGLDEAQVDAFVAEGKAVVCQSMSLHATEIGGTQMAPELVYDLVTREDEEAQRILNNTILLLIPSFNPDGQVMVTDWYNETLGGEYEGVSLPWLYHPYAGHDNNRDGDFLNLVESKYAAKIMYQDWKPQAYIDHHHMGSYGARFYVPPYSEPMRPYADPLVWREMSLFGGHIALKLEEAGKSGILNKAQYPGWGHFGWHWITPFHNMAGMLTESASAKLATPILIHPDQLRGGAREWSKYEAQTTIPSLWPGGWWHLRDIVEQKKISAWAMLDVAARHRETVVRNAYLKSKRQRERGAAGSPKAYVVPSDQHDPLTAVTMINTLLQSDIEILQASKDFKVGDVSYGAGSIVIPLAQPKMGLVRNLLNRTRYPDNDWTRGRDGAPLRPYDSATHTMAEYMGVRVDPIDGAAEADFVTLTAPVSVAGRVEQAGEFGYLLDGRLNASYRAVNQLSAEGIKVRRVDEASPGLQPGDFIVPAGRLNVLEKVATETGVDFSTLKTAPTTVHEVKQLRAGMYKRYWGGNMDEGWTRLTLETFDFPYTSLRDKEIQGGDLRAKYDVIILPHDRIGTLMGKPESRWGGPPPSYPEEYRSGLGDEGVEALQAFVEAGGTLVALGGATKFAIEKFELRVRNVVDDLSSKEFFCPGSTVKATFDNTHPLAYGMPSEGLVLFWNSPTFQIAPSQHNEWYETIVRFGDKDLLQSGWLIGEEHIAGKAGMVVAKSGEGRVVLIGFRTQNRTQTHGTFKLLFNALLGS
ncbi:MAG: peptidase M14 family protein [bacterium]|nr:peptidase M14 family protein [bacterium]